jgi:hypothetical protein
VTIDPQDLLAAHAIIAPPANAGSNNAAPQRITPFRHFRNVLNNSCVVCRINFPFTNTGLAAARKPVNTPALGVISTCRDHRKANAFCGVCLREAPPYSIENEADCHLVSCADNEDEETWPGVEATCRNCREEGLWRRVMNSAHDREAIGGPRWESADWETRQTVDTFIECGEGTVSEVLNVAQEKYWLRKNTKISDMLSQALAASRLASREDATAGYESEDELSEDEEDPELLSLTEDAGGVRDLAVNDWARHRILDGHWYSPADQFYGHTVSDRPVVVPASHPCPWTVEDEDSATTHPLMETVMALTPKSLQLCDQIYRAYQKQMRLILLPAMNNLVRKLVMECTADGIDPALKASRMDLEDVVNELREEGVWFNGVDWLERKENKRKDEQRESGRANAKEEDDSSASSKSDGSHTTSPVLSTTTLQTTPSPPPNECKDEPVVNSPTQWPIPIGPNLNPPQLLHSIPYIPVTLSHLPLFSFETISSVSDLQVMSIMAPFLIIRSQVWREATIPLYHCRCRICERATLKANVASGMATNQALSVAPPTLQKPLEVEIKQTAEVSVEEEEEEDDDLTSITESTTDMVITSKKRSSAELDGDGDTVESDDEVTHSHVNSPPKRPRTKGSYSPVTVENESPRMRKRSSEELEEGLEVPVEQLANKRIRTSPSSTYAESESIAEEGSEGESVGVGEDDRLLLRLPAYRNCFN